MEWWLIPIAIFLALACAGWWLTKAVPFRAEAHCRSILESGHQSGRPKGLRWVGCQPNGDVRIINDLTLAPYEIRFEVIPGSEMEGIEAATIPRPVVAVFRRSGRGWMLTRPPIFNLTIEQVARQFTT